MMMIMVAAAVAKCVCVCLCIGQRLMLGIFPNQVLLYFLLNFIYFYVYGYFLWIYMHMYHMHNWYPWETGRQYQFYWN